MHSEVLELSQKERIDTEKKIMSQIYELQNKKNSDFIKEGTERSISPEHLNTPSTLKLSLRVPIMIKGVGKRRIQYIPNAPTLFIDDYQDENGKIQPGLTTLKYDINAGYREATQMKIRFNHGLLKLADYEGDPLLAKFLEIHPDNVDSPYHNKNSKLFAFKALNKEANAQEKLKPIETEHEAVGLVLALRKKEPGAGKDKKYVYDLPRIDAYLRMMGIGSGIAEAAEEQKIELLVAAARKMPSDFIDTIEDSTSEYTMSIGKAVTSKVISFDKKEAKFADETKAFIVFDKESKATAEEQLMFYFLTPDGAEKYNKMILKTSEAGANSLK